MLSFGKKKTIKPVLNTEDPITQAILEDLINKVEALMPGLIDYYLNNMKTQLSEAGSDIEKIRTTWTSVRTAMDDAPNMVDAELRSQHQAVFDVLRKANADYMVSGFIKQKVASHIYPLMDKLKGEWDKV
jgi:hypothetical protein